MFYHVACLLESSFFLQGYAIVVTGHSLGGGVASVLAILIEKELNCPLQSSLLKCYAYSPPSGILR